MNDENALTISTESPIAPALPVRSMAEAAARAKEYTRAAKLTKYQQGLRPETVRRQKIDLRTFADFLESIGVTRGDFYNDLDAWAEITGDLIETFIDWQLRKGYAIGSINVRLATVKAYCHLAYAVGKMDTDTHTYIQGVKGIQRKQARNIDKSRERPRRGYKKAAPVDIPLEVVQALKHPGPGFLAARDALLMCLLLDHGLRVGEVAILTKKQINLKVRHRQKKQIRGVINFDRPKVDKDEQKAWLTEDTYKAACAYLPTLPREQESLFDLAITSIQERVRTLGKRAGLPGLSPHDCRHSWATRAAANGTTLDRLKQAGGWSNLETPLGYIKASEYSNEGVILE